MSYIVPWDVSYCRFVPVIYDLVPLVILRYRLSLIGRDSTREAEFIVRGNAARTMIGLPVHEVIVRY
jgi:hypothetical protein